MKSGNVICILAKNPKGRDNKNGLERLIGNKKAALLSRALLLDVISTALKVPRSDVFIAHWPAEAQKDFEDIIYLFKNEEKNKRIVQRAEEIELIPQIGQDINERLMYISKTLFENNARRVLFICSENPLLDPMILKIAFELLKDNRVVIGPTFDGSFYLLGLDGYYTEIFDNIDWNLGNVYRQLKERLDASGMSWQELEISYDINRPEELEQLYSDIDNLRLAGENDLGYHTEKCLVNLKK